MPSPLSLLYGTGSPFPGQRQVVIGRVSAHQPLPTRFTDPLYVVLDAANPDEAKRITNWPVIHGATLPAANAQALVVFDDNNNPHVVWWDGIYT